MKMLSATKQQQQQQPVKSSTNTNEAGDFAVSSSSSLSSSQPKWEQQQQQGKSTTTTTFTTSNEIKSETNSDMKLATRGDEAASGKTARANMKVKEFNKFFICFLCRGYKIEATTINDCLHSFCRACIVKHLEDKHYCPECFSNSVNTVKMGGQQLQSPRIVTSQNIYYDRALSALIFKMVPGLFQKEKARVCQFWSKIDAQPVIGDASNIVSGSMFERSLFSKRNSTEEANNCDTEEEIFFSPEESINLSLEYYSQQGGVSDSTDENVRYLQCPAGVRIRHLKKFLFSKFNLNSQLYLVDIIYDEEVLSPDINLMDVAYSYNYKKDSPMRFYYRIFIAPKIKSEFLEPLPPKPKPSNGNVVVPIKVSKEESTKPKIEIHTEKKVSSISLSLKGVLRKSGGDRDAVVKELKPKFASAPVAKLPEPNSSQTVADSTSAPTKKSVSNTSKSNVSSIPLGKSSVGNGGCGGIAGNVPNNRSPDKRKSRDEFDFVEEIIMPESSQINNKKCKPEKQKSVKFNDNVECVDDVENSKRFRPNSDDSKAPARNDFKRLRSNDFVTSDSFKKKPSSPTNPTASSSSSISLIPISSTTPVSSHNDSSKASSGTVPGSKFKQFTGINQEPLAKPKSIVKNSGLSTNNLDKTVSTIKEADSATGLNQKCYLNKGRVTEKAIPKSNPSQIYSRNDNLNPESTDNNDLVASTKYEYVKKIGLKPIHEVFNFGDQVRVDKNKNVIDYKSAKEESSSRKRKKSKHSSKDFPFADTKKKKVDYDLTITTSASSSSSSSTPKMGSPVEQRSPPSSESLKMKFVKVVSKANDSAKVVLINSSSEANKSKERKSSEKSHSAGKVTSPKEVAPEPTYTSSICLSNFIVKDNSMEIRHVPSLQRSISESVPVKKVTSPPTTITPAPKKPSPPRSSLSSNSNLASAQNNSHKTPKPHVGGHLKRSPSVDQASMHMLPLKQHRSDKNSSGVNLQRSYSFDPSLAMDKNLNSSKYMNLNALQQQQQMMLQFQGLTKNHNFSSPAYLSQVPHLAGPKPVAQQMNMKQYTGAKKPLPPLLPPSSINVNFPKFGNSNLSGDVSQNFAANKSASLSDKPPMVEIVRLPPGLDKIEIPSTKSLKATRPPPPPIPLVKIRKAGSTQPQASSLTSSAEIGKTKEGDSRGPKDFCDNTGALDLSGKARSLLKSDDGKPPALQSLTTPSKPKSNTRPLLPVPQLNEISKINRSGGGMSLIRQQSASVRNVPNPSALALRNQQVPSSNLPTLPNGASAKPSSSQGNSSTPSRPILSALSSSSLTLQNNGKCEEAKSGIGEKVEGMRKTLPDKTPSPLSGQSSSSSSSAMQGQQKTMPQTTFSSKSCNLEKLANKIKEGAAVTLSSAANK